jgi:hypothetical protein
VLTLDQVPADFQINSNQRLQGDCFKSNTTHIDSEKIREFLQGMRHPFHFLDFETFGPGIPLYDHSRPYQQIPFQYSLHISDNEQGELHHSEFLGVPQEDHRQGFIEKLLSDSRVEGDIIVYKSAFEIRILKELIRCFPEYADRVAGLIEWIKDLMVPFQKRYYYKDTMQGSYSIKAVLPALVPELDYNDLAITDGNAARYAFEEMLGEMDESGISETRSNLLDYCKRDMLAKIRIIEVLRNP